MRSRCAGRVGATPKPQFPITTEVTPCHGEIPEDLGVVVRVNVDETGRDGGALGVEHAPGRAGHGAERGDAAVADRDVAPTRRCARPVDERPAADQQVEVLGHPWSPGAGP